MLDLRKKWQYVWRCYVDKRSTTKYVVGMNWTSSHETVEKHNFWPKEFKYLIFRTARRIDESYDENKQSIN